MSQISNALGAGSAASSTTSNAFNDIDLNVFLELMITELQNQDPLNPLENDELLAQISQIREVGATDKLTQTLDAVLLGQNVSSATNLIGADVGAMIRLTRVDVTEEDVDIDRHEAIIPASQSSGGAPRTEASYFTPFSTYSRSTLPTSNPEWYTTKSMSGLAAAAGPMSTGSA